MNLKYLPNALSLFRIVLVPFYLLSFYFFEGVTSVTVALIIFVVAGITDYLDGYIARKYDCVTDVGKIIDPLADKLIVTVALISLIIPPIKLISIVPVIIILFREVFVTVLRRYYTRKNIYIPADYWGKVKTVLQMAGIIASLVFVIAKEYIGFLQAYEHVVTLCIRIFFWIVVVVTVISGARYVVGAMGNKSK